MRTSDMTSQVKKETFCKCFMINFCVHELKGHWRSPKANFILMTFYDLIVFKILMTFYIDYKDFFLPESLISSLKFLAFKLLKSPKN